MNTSKYKKMALLFGVAVIVFVAYSAGLYSGSNNALLFNSIADIDNREPGEDSSLEKVDFAPFWKTWQILDEKYVGDGSATSKERIYGAIEGMTNALGDPYTVFLPPKENEEFNELITGNFSGVGIEIGMKNEILTVIAPLKGTPAYRAGIKAGDKIIQIDDTPTINLNIDEAIDLIRGEKGTEVILTVSRAGEGTIPIPVIRDTINIPTIETEIQITGTGEEQSMGELLADGIFTIRLYNFGATSHNDFRTALREFVISSGDKLLLDLRGNPGGFLDSAVDMASWFLPLGTTVVSEDYGDSRDPIHHRSAGYDVFNEHLKMVILVDGGSASASEILAGALREHGVAKLVGTQTFGKGSVQELVEITPETSLKVTVARWLTPNGTSISDGGLTPDIEVEITDEDFEEDRDPQMDRAMELLKSM